MEGNDMNNPIDPFDELAAMFLTARQPQPPGAARMTPAPTPAWSAPAMSSPRSGAQSCARPIAMTELLIVGHLPVRASLWLVPYADMLAREVGTVGLVRLDGQEPTLQLLRAPQTMA